MGLTQALSSKSNVKKSTTQDIPFSPLFPVSARSTPASTTLGQTVFNLPFSVDTINNPNSTFLVIDGKTLSIGSGNDYTFSAINQQGYSSQITYSSSAPALPAGLNWFAYSLGVRREAEFNMDNRFVQLYAAQNAGFQPFVDTSNLLSPTTTTGTPAAGTFYSSIPNRSKIVDITQDLRASMGSERIETQQITQVQSEYGPNGEFVWSAINDDRGLVRFIGLWNNTNDNNGVRPQGGSANTTDYLEVTFYGTGLNGVFQTYATPTGAYSVDGGGETSFTCVTSTILNGRNYATNVVVPIVAGLTLGVHTVKIRQTTSGAPLQPYGFEILNQSSAINVNPGVSYAAGQKLTLSSSQSVSYNSTFESGSLGTRGGHVVVYQKADGTIAKAVTPTNTSQLNMTSADHTNEEIVRVYYPREFGAGRSDDFSQNGQYARAFTLDDGITALLGSANTFFQPAANNTIAQEGIFSNTTNDFITFTFVGTGLDIGINDSSTSTVASTYTFAVDGVNIATGQTGQTPGRVLKIVSGLPYGTHTFRLTCTTLTGTALQITKYMVYQPKKPSIPSGSIELCDYNILANYVADTTGTTDTVSSGVLFKQMSRDNFYTGTWGALTLSAVSNGPPEGWFSTVTSAAAVQFTFFGTGFEIFSGGTGTNTVKVDGTNYTGSATALGSGSWNAGTSTWTVGGSNGNKLSIQGLALGLHTITVTWVSGTWFYHGYSITTPIYSAKSNINFDQQNTLLIGSSAMSDNRKFSPVKDQYLQKKNVSQALGSISGPTTSSTSFVPLPDMAVAHFNTSGRVRISFSVEVSSNASTIGKDVVAFVDGVQVNQSRYIGISGVADNGVLSDAYRLDVSPGFHFIQLYWKVSTSSMTALTTQRTLLVEEL